MKDQALAFLGNAHAIELASGRTELSFEAWCAASGIIANARHGWDDRRRRMVIPLSMVGAHDDGSQTEPITYPIVPVDDRPRRARSRRNRRRALH